MNENEPGVQSGDGCRFGPRARETVDRPNGRATALIGVGSGFVGLLLRDQAADPLGEQGAVERLLEGVVES